MHRVHHAAGGVHEQDRTGAAGKGGHPVNRAHPRGGYDVSRDGLHRGGPRAVAERVERLLSEGRYTDAYQQLGLLELVEPDNQAVRDRLAQVGRMIKARK